MACDRKTTLTFSGGLSLAAYHAGVYQTFVERDLPLHWLTGSSAGAITAALIAGNAPEERIARLRAFWQLPEQRGFVAPHPWQHWQGWASAVQTHLVGRTGQFHPRLPSLNPLRFQSLYELAPMRDRLTRLVDFGRLNSGEPRLSVATTDVETGDAVIFDTAHDRIEMDHLMASCGFLPEFAAVEIGPRLLADGGFSLNAPFDPILEAVEQPLTAFVVDLFARDGPRPSSLEAAAERKNDLLFGNQTYQRLKAQIRLRQVTRERAPGDSAGISDDVYLLSYRTGAAEPGPEKTFNFSREAIAQRWNAGRLDMEYALHNALAAVDGIETVRRPAAAPPALAPPG